MTLRPQFAVADVTLANAPWGSRPHMARVGKLLVQLEVLPLLTGTLEVSQISLVETDLLLETGPAGQTNWPVRRGATSGTSVGLKHLDVKSLEIEHLALTWRDPDTGSLGNYKVDSLELTRSATADSLKVALEGSSNGEIVSLSGATGSLSVLFSGARFPVALSGDFGPAKVALNGEIGKPRKLEGIDPTS